MKKGGRIMDGCSFNMTVSALACAIAKGKTSEQINLLGAFFTQLGDSLITITTANELFCDNDNGDNELNNINMS
jgi:NifU-like protein involved in Fe-S cluster formation